MTVSRAGVLITGFALLALSVVYLRGEQTRAAARAVALELKQVQARRELWRAQATVARLRAPTQIRDRLERFPDALRSPLPNG